MKKMREKREQEVTVNKNNSKEYTGMQIVQKFKKIL